MNGFKSPIFMFARSQLKRKGRKKYTPKHIFPCLTYLYICDNDFVLFVYVHDYIYFIIISFSLFRVMLF